MRRHRSGPALPVTRTLIVTLAVLALTWLYRPVGAGVVWDGLNALGFAALAALLVLHLDDLRPGTSAPPRRATWAGHAWLGQAALALVVVHAAGLVAWDAVLLEYLQPGAPAYMWAGVAATVLLVATVWSARLPHRRRLYPTRARFRALHRLAGAATVGLAAWHVAGSGFYLGHALAAAALVALAASVVAAPAPVRAGVDRVTPDLGHWVAAGAILAVTALHTGARNL